MVGNVDGGASRKPAASVFQPSYGGGAVGGGGGAIERMYGRAGASGVRKEQEKRGFMGNRPVLSQPKALRVALSQPKMPKKASSGAVSKDKTGGMSAKQRLKMKMDKMRR